MAVHNIYLWPLSVCKILFNKRKEGNPKVEISIEYKKNKMKQYPPYHFVIAARFWIKSKNKNNPDDHHDTVQLCSCECT